MADNQNGFEFQQALTAVLNTQAATQETMALLMRQIAETEAAIRTELSGIRSEQAAIRTILVRHEELLRGLPDAVRSRIGFQEKTP